MELNHEQQNGRSKKRSVPRLFAFVVLILFLAFVAITAINYYKIINEKIQISYCNSNLKQLVNGLATIAYDGQKNGDVSLQQFPPLQTLAGNNYIDKKTLENLMHCPKTHAEYIYVRYDRPVALVTSIAAANTPVLFDSVIGCHKHRKFNFLGMGADLPWTLVAFEDGHVSIEENLTCFMDIYDRHAQFMSKEDTEVLKRTCEEADRRIQ